MQILNLLDQTPSTHSRLSEESSDNQSTSAERDEPRKTENTRGRGRGRSETGNASSPDSLWLRTP